MCYNGVRLYHECNCRMLARAQPPQETAASAVFTHSCAWGMHSSRKKRTDGILNCMLWRSHQLAALEDREDLQMPALLTPEWRALPLTLKLPRDGLPQSSSSSSKYYAFLSFTFPDTFVSLCLPNGSQKDLLDDYTALLFRLRFQTR